MCEGVIILNTNYRNIKIEKLLLLYLFLMQTDFCYNEVIVEEQ